MIRKNSVLGLLLAVMSLFPSEMRAQQRTVIEPLKGEKWWGGYVALGSHMPFTERDTTRAYDLAAENLANQASPFFVSSAGRYVWSDKPFAFRFEGGNLVIDSEYEEVLPQVAGKTLREAYLIACQRHFPPSGVLPDKLFFSMPQYNTWIELMYDQNQADVLRYASDIKSNGFPAGVIMIDDNWQKYYGNFEFKPDKFPDPKAMVEQLHADGFKVMLWVCPFVSPDSPEYRSLRDRGYLLKEGEGEPALIRWWNGYSACYDLTNPDAYAHLLAQLKQVREKYGIDGFKFDAGDPCFYADDRLRPFTEGALPVDQTAAWARMGLEFPFNEYRACWKGGGMPLVQRLSDKSYSWDAVGLLIPDMLSAGLLGYAYACPDMIGGGEYGSFLKAKDEPIDQSLIVRSAQIHALMPMMQFSVAPWRVLDAEHLAYCREAALLHRKMGDYILELAEEAAQTGAPIVRHMEYEFPGKGFADCDDQFMLGTRYLVAPVTDGRTERTVRLPNGRWIDDKGQLFKGPLVITVQAEKGRLPYFEHQGKAAKKK